MLTIGQLAEHVGVTVRAVRHYHQRGLLAEPDRDASGYRRYDAQAVVDLIRIKTLSDAGVPLARIKELTSAPPGEFSDAIMQIDEALKKKIRDLTRHRRRIADLAEGGGERLFLPPEIVDILDQLRAMGVSERTRCRWSVMRGSWGWRCHRSQSRNGRRRKRRPWPTPGSGTCTWPAMRRSAGIPPTLGSPSLPTRWSRGLQRRLNGSPPGQEVGNPVVVTLLTSQFAASSPAWRRLGELSQAPPRAGH